MNIEKTIEDKIKLINTTIDEVRELKSQEPKYKLNYQMSYGGIINAYREGDISFDECVEELKTWSHASIDHIPIADMIGYLQERGYSVAGTEDTNQIDLDTETIEYISNNVEFTPVYSLFEITSLLNNEKLTNTTIRKDIEALVNVYPQLNGKPEQIMI